MSAEKKLTILLQNLSPILHDGDYVFTTISDSKLLDQLPRRNVIGHFREMEGHTLIVKKSIADEYQLGYKFIAAWITLEVHSALDAVGLTAAFSSHLAKAGISCNVWAGYYHDHIFVAKNDAQKAVEVLKALRVKHNHNPSSKT